MTRLCDHKYDTSEYVILNDRVRRTDNASMTKREQALVEAVRELIRAAWGTSDHLRAELKVSNCVDEYRDDEFWPGDKDVTLENCHE